MEVARTAPAALTEVKVEGRPRGGGKMPSGGESNFVYVNSGYMGSVNSLNAVNNQVARRTNVEQQVVPAAPITDVYREQYWACSRWPYTQRVLAVAVGVLLGALIGLIISISLGDDTDNSVLSPLFTRHAVPD